jgi:hypothetical protein
MVAEFGIVYPLWNHTREPGNLLERVVGEVGIDHMTIPAVTGAMSQFRPFYFEDAPYFQTTGGWHFPPQASRYASSGVRPRAAPWLAGRDVLAPVVDEARKHGVRVYFRISLMEIPELLAHEPHLRQRDAWGSDQISNRACISNPAVRELLAATLTDLERYQPAGLQIANPDLDGIAATGLPFEAAGYARTWFRYCFCAGCRQIAAAAGIDPDQAARRVRVECMRSVTDPQRDAENPFARVADDEVHRYRSVRVQSAGTWLSRVATANARRPNVFLNRLGTELVSGLAPDYHDLRLAVYYDTSAQVCKRELESYVRRFRERFGDFHAIAISAFPEQESNPANRLVQAVADACGAGMTFFDFAHLEESPPEAITWLKQAVRYARRG